MLQKNYISRIIVDVLSLSFKFPKHRIARTRVEGMTAVRPSPPALGGARRRSARAATPPGRQSQSVLAHTLVGVGRASRPVAVGVLQCVREKDFFDRCFLASSPIAIAASNDALNIGRASALDSVSV